MRCKLFLAKATLVLSLCFPVFAAADYKKGNGTVISVTQEKEIIKTLRKCNYSLTIGDSVSADKLTIYEKYDSDKILGNAKAFDQIFILEICDQKKPAPYYTDGYFEQQIWYHITAGKLNGWIKVAEGLTSEYENNYFSPYESDRWSILETIKNGKNKLTVRKYEQNLFVNDKVSVHKDPWQTQDNVITVIDGSEIKQSVKVKKVIEEPALIDDITDYWLYVSYKKYEGWIFGGHTFSSLSPEKYHFPEMIIKDSLNSSDITEVKSSIVPWSFVLIVCGVIFVVYGVVLLIKRQKKPRQECRLSKNKNK